MDKTTLIAFRQTYRLTIVGLLLIVSFGSIAVADETERFLKGLRRFGLFQLAERYCQDKLDNPNLPAERRARLVIELARSLANQAVNAPPDKRQPLWKKSQEVTEVFIHEYSDSPVLPLVQMQLALTRLARGELARQEAAVLINEPVLLEKSRKELRAAVRQLRRLSNSVAEKLRQQHKTSNTERGGLNVDELVSFAKNVKFQLARALRNQGQCYPPDSADRTNSLAQSVKLLEPLTELDSLNPLTWKSRIDRILCYRLLGDYSAAVQNIEATSTQNPTTWAALRIRAEKIQLALATNRLAEAVELANLGRTLDRVSSPELDYALLKTYLNSWQAANVANNTKEAAQWQKKTNDIILLIDQLHGPYWTRRAELLLSDSVRKASESSNLGMLVRAAESSYRSGHLDEALAAYDRAISMAVEQGNRATAFEQAYVAAAIEHTRDRHERALKRYSEMALALPEQPKAPDAFLLAIHHATQIAKSTQTKNSFERYAAMLEQYLKTWPESTQVDTVRLRLARLHQHRKQWQKAIEVYKSISPDNPSYYQVIDAVAKCYRSEMQSKDVTAEAATWFESVLLAPNDRLSERWDRVARIAALHAARFWLDHSPPDYGRAERIVSMALVSSPKAPPQWKSNAHALLVSTLAGKGRHQEAAESIDRLAAGGAANLLKMLETLESIAASAKPKVRAELAVLELQAAELLRAHRAQLAPNNRRRLDRIRAEALAKSGQTSEALKEYAKLSEIYPRDARIQQSYAQLLSTEPNMSSLKQSLAKWRELEAHSKQGTDQWFRAKYALASLHFRLGDREQAAKIIKLLQILHPELGGPTMKPKFLALLRRCQ